MKEALLNQSALITTRFNLNSWQRKLVITTLATIILGISANISIPVYPVPFTLQSIVVLLIGACLGRKLGVLALLQYLALGIMGLPIFANGVGGVAILFSPTLGYLIGYVLSAYVAGFAAEKGYDRKFISGIIMFALAHQIIFVFGVAYLAVYGQMGLTKAFEVGYLPFLGFDVLKFVLASAIMVGLWRFTGRKEQN